MSDAIRRPFRYFSLLSFSSVAAIPLAAQGTLEDYQRAVKFLPGNLARAYSTGDVFPTWIEKSDRFWYRTSGPKGAQFILVDAAQNTSGPAFDQEKLADSLSHAAHREFKATELPFDSFEFVEDGKAIRFEIESATWTCQLSSYECKSSRGAEPGGAGAAAAGLGTPPAPGAGDYENRSPNGRWAAYVKDHNLFVRDTSTGATIQLTHDGIPGYDYATPLPDLRVLITQNVPMGEDVCERPDVFWSPDSTKFVTVRSIRASPAASPLCNSFRQISSARAPTTTSTHCPAKFCRARK